MTDAASWERTLDTLEHHLRSAEALIEGDTGEADRGAGAWVPPHGLGPIPGHLVSRALGLCARQATVMAAIPLVLAENRKQRQVTGRMDSAAGRRSDSVYIDVRA